MSGWAGCPDPGRILCLLGEDVRVVFHHEDGSEDVVVFGGTATSELRYTLWRGDRFVADPAQTLSTTLSTTAALPFGVTRSAS